MLSKRMFLLVWLIVVIFIGFLTQCGGGKEGKNVVNNDLINSVIKELSEKCERGQLKRIEVGVNQVAKFWRAEDGAAGDFRNFCLTNFIISENELHETFLRLEAAFEQIDGTLVELNRELKWNLDVDTGPVFPVDRMLANFSLDSHVKDDLYKSKIAFLILLNFPVLDLDECLENGDNWSREKWAQVRLAQMFIARVPSDISQKIHEAFVDADDYIVNFNIYMHNLLTEDGERLFPEGLKLITHWGLRDELKGQYGNLEGLVCQKMIFEVMKKIITQEIPKDVINNPEVDWKVASNEVVGKGFTNSAEPDTRYRKLLNIFLAEKAVDQYYPLYPTFMDRRFNLNREIPEKTVEKLFKGLLISEEFQQTGRLIEKRLGRKLQPFDIWYNGFRPNVGYTEDKLTEIVKKRYSDAKTFEKKIPQILGRLGFDNETAVYLQERIKVDPARGAGHAMGSGRRGDEAHLRTRIPESGMDYKGFNIAVHELGHNVEQTFSLYKIDHTSLEGVPNTAFTEAFAFVFQGRDLDILGLEKKDEMTKHINALDQIWSACEIAGVSLVDMAVWNWMYAHPDCTPGELKNATIAIAREIWNEYFYPVLGHKDALILGIYSHMIDAGLYLPDYPIGQLIQFQIERYLKDKNLGVEMERMCIIGSTTPDYWMKKAVGEPISIQPLLNAVREALQVIDK